MKKSVKILLFIASFVAIERFCHTQTHGFRVGKIKSDLPFNKKWETKALSPLEEQQVSALLKQPYYFLGSGGQAYAFVSQDGTAVIKFFKLHHVRSLDHLNKIPLPSFLESSFKKIKGQREERFLREFESYKIAYDKFKDRTGLLYLHLNKTRHLHKTLTIFDNLGIAHKIDLDTTEFALQRHADLLYTKINDYMKAGDPVNAKLCIQSFLELIAERCSKGIADRDPVTNRNFGCIDSEVIEIDLGSYSRNDLLKKTDSYKKVIFFETLKLRKWLKKRHPTLLPFLDENLQLIYDTPSR